MLIPAARFRALPDACPVLWGDTPATVLGRHGATEHRIRVTGRLPTTTAAAQSQLRVDLSTPAAVRAFAPALIQDLAGAVAPPAPVWHRDSGRYILVASLEDADSGDVANDCAGVTGPTPEKCLLNGLKAALAAACVAVGGAS